jgi:LRP1 type putative zinc finger protein
MMRRGRGVMGSSRCQDCGNQAKKDCVYMRCRTCCKNKGFRCETHVKSTWVPLYRRRQRQQLLAAVLPQNLQGHNPKRHTQIPSSGTVSHTSKSFAFAQCDFMGTLKFPFSLVALLLESNSNKHISIEEGRPRPPYLSLHLLLLHYSYCWVFIYLFIYSGSKDQANLPAEVHSMATFCCIRVSSMGDAVDEYAYQTSVNIGGHVFRGILYDQGPESRYSTAGEGSSLALEQPNLATASTTNSANAEPLILASSSPFHFNAFMPGKQFLPRPKS